MAQIINEKGNPKARTVFATVCATESTAVWLREMGAKYRSTYGATKSDEFRAFHISILPLREARRLLLPADGKVSSHDARRAFRLLDQIPDFNHEARMLEKAEYLALAGVEFCRHQMYPDAEFANSEANRLFGRFVKMDGAAGKDLPRLKNLTARLAALAKIRMEITNSANHGAPATSSQEEKMAAYSKSVVIWHVDLNQTLQPIRIHAQDQGITDVSDVNLFLKLSMGG